MVASVSTCKAKKITLVSENVGDEKNLHPGTQAAFSSFSLFVWCILKFNMYLLIHIWLCSRVSVKKNFICLISGNKTSFFLGGGVGGGLITHTIVCSIQSPRKLLFILAAISYSLLPFL